MRSRWLQHAAMAVVSAVAIGVTACHPEESTPKGASDPCKVASTLPGYTVTQVDGSQVTVPPGRVLVREASMEGLNGAALTRACKAFVRQYQEDRG